MLLAKSKLNSIEVLISKALIDSNIIHDEFVLINKVLKEVLWYKRKNQKVQTIYKRKKPNKGLDHMWNNVMLLFEA